MRRTLRHGCTGVLLQAITLFLGIVLLVILPQAAILIAGGQGSEAEGGRIHIGRRNLDRPTIDPTRMPLTSVPLATIRAELTATIGASATAAPTSTRSPTKTPTSTQPPTVTSTSTQRPTLTATVTREPDVGKPTPDKAETPQPTETIPAAGALSSGNQYALLIIAALLVAIGRAMVTIFGNGGKQIDQ